MRISTHSYIFSATRILILDVSKAKDTKTKIEKFTRLIFLSIFAILQDIYTLSIQLVNKDIRVSIFQSIDRDKIKKLAAVALMFGGFYLIKSKYYNFINSPEDQVVKSLNNLIQNPQSFLSPVYSLEKDNSVVRKAYKIKELQVPTVERSLEDLSQKLQCLIRDSFYYPTCSLEKDNSVVRKAYEIKELQVPIVERSLEDLSLDLQCLIRDSFYYPTCSLEKDNSVVRKAYEIKELQVPTVERSLEDLSLDLQCLIKDKPPYAMYSFRNISKVEEPQTIKENHLGSLKKKIEKIIFNSNMGGIFGRDLKDRDIFIYKNAMKIIESNMGEFTPDVIQSVEYLLKQMGDTRLKDGDLYKDYGYGHLAVSYINSTSINTAVVRQFFEIVKKINYPKKKDKMISNFYEILRKTEQITDENTLLNEILPNENFGVTIRNTSKEITSFSMKSIFESSLTFFSSFLEISSNFFKGLYYLNDSSNIKHNILLIEDFSLEKFESIKDEIFLIDQSYVRNELFLFLIIEFLKSISSIESSQIDAILDLLNEIGDSKFSDKITFKDTIKAFLIHKLIESTKEFNLENIQKIMDLINEVENVKVKVKLAIYLKKFKIIYQLLD
jgi:hypothetical protein